MEDSIIFDDVLHTARSEGVSAEGEAYGEWHAYLSRDAELSADGRWRRRHRHWPPGRWLRRRGRQVTVLTAPPEGASAPAGLPEVMYHDVSDPAREPNRLAELCERLRHRHQQQPFDVILAYFVYPSGYLATCLGDALGLPVICSCRGKDISKDMFITPDILDAVLRQCARLIL